MTNPYAFGPRTVKPADQPPAPIRNTAERLTELARDVAADPMRDPWHPELILIADGEAADELDRLLPNLSALEREHRFLAMVDWADQIAQGDEEGRAAERDVWQAGVDGMDGEVQAALLADILAAGGGTV